MIQNFAVVFFSCIQCICILNNFKITFMIVKNWGFFFFQATAFSTFSWSWYWSCVCGVHSIQQVGNGSRWNATKRVWRRKHGDLVALEVPGGTGDKGKWIFCFFFTCYAMLDKILLNIANCHWKQCSKWTNTWLLLSVIRHGWWWYYCFNPLPNDKF